MAPTSIQSIIERARHAVLVGDQGSADALYRQTESQGELKAGEYRDWSEMYAAAGRHREAEQVLRQGLTRHSGSSLLFLSYAELQRRFDDRDGAARILQHLLQSAPDDPDALALAAQVDLERGHPAIPLFDRALAANQGNLPLVASAAAALQAEGRTDAAIDLLSDAVRTAPQWKDGLRLLARLQWERGDGEAFTEPFEKLLAQRPADTELWASYLGLLASSLLFDRVLGELPRARAAAGDQTIFAMLEAQALAETGQIAAAEPVFAALGALKDPGFVPVRMRALLRAGRAEEAARLGEAFTGSPAAPFIWPMLSLAWRVTDDPRWHWLEPVEAVTGEFDLSIPPAELGEIAQFVRGLHRSKGQPYDQSLRGGTQTIGNLFDRTDAPIVRLRGAVREAVATFIAGLPPIDPRHPFLGRNRGPFQFAGSWSVRLEGKGHHVAHVHPMGWISSTLYLALPPLDSAAEGNYSPAGWLGLGGAPRELGLGLEPVKWIRPEPGKLVLFPFMMWHETAPFAEGERLTAACDIVPLR